MPNDTNIDIFLEGFELYQKVIRHDYMAHADLHQAVERFFYEHEPAGPRLLDLGCGDAWLSSKFMRHDRFHDFHGVDLSAKALKEAQKRLAMAKSVSFAVEDLAEFVGGSSLTFDAVFVGYSLHHFATDRKAKFLRMVRDRLDPTSHLLIYDVFCETNESREAYLARYLGWVRKTWLEMNEREHQLIVEHISGSDFPESADDLSAMAERAGLKSLGERWCDASGFHRLLVFQAPSDRD
ncbi:MAG: methyltransferase domain-containing protein [Verrucomicrobiota bacterium]